MEFESCTKTFNKLPDEKKVNILSIAIDEFSLNGFNSANVNIISEKANVSVGGIYKYFKNKRAMYMTCLEWTLGYMQTMLEEITTENNDVFSIFENVIRTLQKFKKKYEPFNKLYYEMANESNAEHAMMISSKIEGITSNLYSAYLESAKTNNEIRQDIDSRFFAFFIDNLFMMLQFSYSCEYYKDRMQIYTYADVIENDEQVTEQLMLFIKGALLYRN